MSALTILQDCVTIQLTQGKNTLIDIVDSELAQQSWHANFDGYSYYADGAKYLGGGAKAPKFKHLKMHRVICGDPPGVHIDHRDGDTLNNTRSNLRIATPGQNKQNRRRTKGKSKFKGVFRYKDKWQAAIQCNKVRQTLGNFATKEEAARAYDKKAIELFGEFAATNAELFGLPAGESIDLRGQYRSTGVSKYKGVGWRHREQVWTANIQIDGKRKQVGQFATELEAALAYDRKCIELFGEFACTNAELFGIESVVVVS